MIPIDAPPAACASELHLVDDAFRQSDGPAANLLRKSYCPTCPIRESCLIEGMADRVEDGIWGSLRPSERHKLRRSAWRTARR